ncbi:MAG: MBL fold metallo-hydrolase [Bacteroidota bacterium]
MENTVDDNKMRITFLGTGTSTGVPVIACDCTVCQSSNPKDNRTRTSIMIQTKGKTIVIDCGPDFRAQMLRENVIDLDAILFTHEHRDHIAGIDDVRSFNYVLNKSIDLYAQDRVFDSIKTEFPYIFNCTRYFGAPQVNLQKITDEPFNLMGIDVIPINAMHDEMPILGYRIGDFTYITDASAISDKELEKVKGSKILVLNALRNSRHCSHFSLGEAIEVVNKIKPERAYFTHMSHFIGLHDVVASKLPENMELAWDGLIVNA